MVANAARFNHSGFARSDIVCMHHATFWELAFQTTVQPGFPMPSVANKV